MSRFTSTIDMAGIAALAASATVAYALSYADTTANGIYCTKSVTFVGITLGKSQIGELSLASKAIPFTILTFSKIPLSKSYLSALAPLTKNAPIS